jgi:ParB-like chromosome segregation protein Spo0J
VRKRPNDRYLLIAGERRVRAASLARWNSMLCQVRSDLDARKAHTIRVVENLHRQNLNPLDQATALKISWLIANADALGLIDGVTGLLERELPQTQLLQMLEHVLAGAGFTPTHPAVPWDRVLDKLGVEMTPDSRKKLMRVLSLAPDVQELARPLGLTEAALRSIGTLEEQDQRQLVSALAETPELTRKVRRIARVVREGSHTLDEAIAEARGQTRLDEAEEVQGESIPEDERITDQVIRLLEAATSAQQAVDELRTLLGPNYTEQLPGAWKDYAAEAIHIMQAIAKEY